MVSPSRGFVEGGMAPKSRPSLMPLSGRVGCDSSTVTRARNPVRGVGNFGPSPLSDPRDIDTDSALRILAITTDASGGAASHPATQSAQW